MAFLWRISWKTWSMYNPWKLMSYFGKARRTKPVLEGAHYHLKVYHGYGNSAVQTTYQWECKQANKDCPVLLIVQMRIITGVRWDFKKEKSKILKLAFFLFLSFSVFFFFFVFSLFFSWILLLSSSKAYYGKCRFRANCFAII